MSNRIGWIAPACALLALGAFPEGLAGEQEPGARREPPAVAFGYMLGEERRYVLEPREGLRQGEEAFWEIRFERFEGEWPERFAVFTFSHERTWPIMDFIYGGRLDRVEVEGELTVNPYGFPHKLVITEREAITGESAWEGEPRTTIYVFADEGFTKHVELGDKKWDFEVVIANHRELDLEVPSGLYLFLPTGLPCMGAVPGDLRRPYVPDCDEADPAMANPGFLSLVLPMLWEDRDREHKLLFFTPTSVGTQPRGLMNAARFIGRERDSQSNLKRYFEHSKIKLVEYEEVEVGERSFDAWRIDVDGGVGDIWVDTDGTVLRVELGPHPGKGIDRWIRLLFPSEY